MQHPSLLLKNRHDHLVFRIARRIIGGDLGAGDVIRFEEFTAGDERVSRGSLREALRVLSTMGLVEARPKIGTRVRPRRFWKLIDRDFLLMYFLEDPEPGFVHNIFEVRRIIEPAAAAIAAERAEDADIAALEAALARMEGATHDPRQWFDADFEFHRTIFAMTRNVILEQFVSIISITLLSVVRLPSHRLRPLGSSLGLHKGIVDSIRARDPEGAAAASLRLIDHALAAPKAASRPTRRPRSSALAAKT